MRHLHAIATKPATLLSTLGLATGIRTEQLEKQTR